MNEWINQAIAILVLGFFIWLGTRIEARWRRFRLSRASAPPKQDEITDIPQNWREMVIRPFKGWKFFLFLTLAFLPWVIIKEVLNEKGVIFGAIPATLLLFLLVWLIGIGFALIRKWWQRTSSIKAFWYRNLKMIVVGAILAVIVGGFWYYSDRSAEAKWLKWSCLQKIEYAPGENGFYYFSTDKSQRFKTQDEAMEYCLTKSKYSGVWNKYVPIVAPAG